MDGNGNGNGRVIVNLATGLEDPERVTVAFLLAGAAADAGKQVTIFLTKEAVRLALPGFAEGVACDGCPPLPTLATQFAQAGGRRGRTTTPESTRPVRHASEGGSERPREAE